MNMNMKVGTRLGIGFGIVVMLLIGMTLFGINRMSSLNDGTSLLVNDRYPKVVLANEILDGINFNALAMRNLLITEDPEKIKAALSEIKSNYKGFPKNSSSCVLFFFDIFRVLFCEVRVGLRYYKRPY